MAEPVDKRNIFRVAARAADKMATETKIKSDFNTKMAQQEAAEEAQLLAGLIAADRKRSEYTIVDTVTGVQSTTQQHSDTGVLSAIDLDLSRVQPVQYSVLTPAEIKALRDFFARCTGQIAGTLATQLAQNPGLQAAVTAAGGQQAFVNQFTNSFITQMQTASTVFDATEEERKATAQAVNAAYQNATPDEVVAMNTFFGPQPFTVTQPTVAQPSVQRNPEQHAALRQQAHQNNGYFYNARIVYVTTRVVNEIAGYDMSHHVYVALRDLAKQRVRNAAISQFTPHQRNNVSVFVSPARLEEEVRVLARENQGHFGITPIMKPVVKEVVVEEQVQIFVANDQLQHGASPHILMAPRPAPGGYASKEELEEMKKRANVTPFSMGRGTSAGG